MPEGIEICDLVGGFCAPAHNKNGALLTISTRKAEGGRWKVELCGWRQAAPAPAPRRETAAAGSSAQGVCVADLSGRSGLNGTARLVASPALCKRPSSVGSCWRWNGMAVQSYPAQAGRELPWNGNAGGHGHGPPHPHAPGICLLTQAWQWQGRRQVPLLLLADPTSTRPWDRPWERPWGMG